MSECKPILIEISPGELIDRVTILQIRRSRVTDPVKAALVRAELESLLKIAEQSLPRDSEVEGLAEELRSVNEALWELEDDIRAVDATGELGAEFIELARSVCRMNDRRSELKRCINSTLGYVSADQKQYGTRAVWAETAHETVSPGSAVLAGG